MVQSPQVYLPVKPTMSRRVPIWNGCSAPSGKAALTVLLETLGTPPTRALYATIGPAAPSVAPPHCVRPGLRDPVWPLIV